MTNPNSVLTVDNEGNPGSVVPGTSGNVLTSNGTTWGSSPPSGGSGGSSSSVYWRLQADAGAAGNGSTDDTAAINSWIAHGFSTGQPLWAEAPSVSYLCAGQVNFDANDYASDGLIVHGTGVFRCIFQSTYTSGVPFVFKNSGGGNFQGLEIKNLGFVGNYNGPLVQIAREDTSGSYPDSMTAGDFKISCQNGSTGSSAVGCEMNFVGQSTFRIWAGTGAGGAAALRLRNVQMSQFDTLSLGGSNIGLHLTHGYNDWNTFISPDIEQVGICVQADSGSNSHNTFISGTYNYNNYGLNLTAGSTYYFFNPQESPNSGASGWAENNTGLSQW